jgi:hypothetical protein
MPTNGKVTWFKSTNNLAEIYQSVNMKFAFAKKSEGIFIQCHKWIKCRDFLHDAVRTALTGKKSSIFGFTFEKGINPELDLENMTMLVSQKGLEKEDELLPNLNRALKIINHYESIAGQPFSKLTKVEPDKISDYKHVWIIQGPKMWMTAPYLISMFTFLLRLGCKNVEFTDSASLEKALEKVSKEEKKDNDINYLKTIWNKLEVIIVKHSTLIEEKGNGYSNLYFQDANIQSFHNNSGIVSVCNANTWSHKFNEKIKNVLKEK